MKPSELSAQAIATRAAEEAVLMRAQAEAAAWMSLLNAPQRSAATEQGLRRWIAASPLHARVWEVATDLWSETANLPRRIPRSPARNHPKQWLRLPALALALVCLLTIAIFADRSFRPTVATAVGEQRILNLDDGTRVELNTDSRLRIRFDAQARTVELLSGEVYFQVAHERRPFVVIAGQRKIVAVGTAFTVRRDDSSGDAVTVTMIEGRVAVSSANSQGARKEAPDAALQVLSAGQRLRARADGTAAVDTPSLDKATGWMRGQLIFDHTPLSEAAAEFNRYDSFKILVTSPDVGAIPIGGIFKIGDARSLARAVAQSHGLTVEARGHELILRTRPEASSAAPR